MGHAGCLSDSIINRSIVDPKKRLNHKPSTLNFRPMPTRKSTKMPMDKKSQDRRIRRFSTNRHRCPRRKWQMVTNVVGRPRKIRGHLRKPPEKANAHESIRALHAYERDVAGYVKGVKVSGVHFSKNSWAFYLPGFWGLMGSGSGALRVS